jgi:hypothetical protein
MAAAARPDARVPCPLCGGLIHPIAGRCKHCKADVAGARGARPAAAIALPALLPAEPPPPRGPLGPEPPAAGLGSPAPGAAGRPRDALGPPRAPAAPHQADPAPVLPPRPTGGLPAVPSAARARSLWRSWPVIVIVLAGLAIATAVVLLVVPADPVDAGTRGVGRDGAPAPDRMPTAPPSGRAPAAPPSTGPDPWADPAPPAAPSPAPPDPDPAVDDPDLAPGQLPDPPDPPDPAASGLSLPRGGTGAARPPRVPFHQVVRWGCARARACGAASPAVASVCAPIESAQASSPPPGCPAARACRGAIADVPCASLQRVGQLEQLRLLPACAATLDC